MIKKIALYCEFIIIIFNLYLISTLKNLTQFKHISKIFVDLNVSNNYFSFTSSPLSLYLSHHNYCSSSSFCLSLCFFFFLGGWSWGLSFVCRVFKNHVPELLRGSTKYHYLNIFIQRLVRYSFMGYTILIAEFLIKNGVLFT